MSERQGTEAESRVQDYLRKKTRIQLKNLSKQRWNWRVGRLGVKN